MFVERHGEILDLIPGEEIHRHRNDALHVSIFASQHTVDLAHGDPTDLREAHRNRMTARRRQAGNGVVDVFPVDETDWAVIPR